MAGGRPKQTIDLTTLENLCMLHPTVEEIAAFFGVSRKTIERRMQESASFVACIEKGRAKGRLSLRRKQVEAAMSGNTALLIFLGKNLLGQSDDPPPPEDLHDQSVAVLAAAIREAARDAHRAHAEAVTGDRSGDSPLEPPHGSDP